MQELLARYPQLISCEEAIFKAYSLLLSSFHNGGKLLACGNGGSAADSEHVVGELMKSFQFHRAADSSFLKAYREVNGTEPPEWLEGALPAISLVSQTSFSTAFGNDEAAVGIFAQQVYGYGQPGDVLLAISTSGLSANVIEAARVARAKGMKVVSLTGAHDTCLTKMSDAAIRVPETEVFKVQELHLPIYHCLCAMVESAVFGGVE